MIRGRRLAFVGDLLNRNMWESLVCILKGLVKVKSQVFEAHGRHQFRWEAEYSFVFKLYEAQRKVYATKGEEQETGKKEFIEEPTTQITLLLLPFFSCSENNQKLFIHFYHNSYILITNYKNNV
ncbi:unnamed protein product [Brassica oleracea]